MTHLLDPVLVWLEKCEGISHVAPSKCHSTSSISCVCLLKWQWSRISLDHSLCVCVRAPAHVTSGQAGSSNDRAVPGKGRSAGSVSQSHLVSPRENMWGSHFLSRLHLLPFVSFSNHSFSFKARHLWASFSSSHYLNPRATCWGLSVRCLSQ